MSNRKRNLLEQTLRNTDWRVVVTSSFIDGDEYSVSLETSDGSQLFRAYSDTISGALRDLEREIKVTFMVP